MHECLNRFIDNLIHQYRMRSDISYVQYDGCVKPTLLTEVPEFHINTGEMAKKVDAWIVEYLSNVEEVHYYTMYKSLLLDVFNVWVNPSLKELKAFNEEIGLDPLLHLDDFSSFSNEWCDNLFSKTKADLEDDGYKFASGIELINDLVQEYDAQSEMNLTLVDWMKPTDVSEIDNQCLYIIDLECICKPILFEERFLLERDNQDYRITPNNLKHYLENVIVTQRGLVSRAEVKDKNITFNYYYSIIHYLKMNPYENKESTFRKLLEDAVDPSQPFIEAVTDYMGELYINNSLLRTEKAVLDFINLAYVLEELDLEAKSFDRKKIMVGKLNKKLPKSSKINDSSIRNMHKSMIEMNYTNK